MRWDMDPQWMWGEYRGSNLSLALQAGQAGGDEPACVIEMES